MLCTILKSTRYQLSMVKSSCLKVGRISLLAKMAVLFPEYWLSLLWVWYPYPMLPLYL